ncbi:MAG: leucine-rich repeat domain-containing protein [Verrucomicrobiales bacterium]|nr:leucine-rich repeat domain-containing protein [Verrucomicrobiales bacterium]
MKTSIVLAVCFGASPLALGQGLINLRNKVSPTINARVYDMGDNPLSGSDGWVAQAYVSDAETGPYTPVAGAVTHFYGDRDVKFGYLVPLVAAVPGIPENTPIWVRLYVWNMVDGETYELADDVGGEVGASNPVHVTLGGPDAPADLVGLKSWSVWSPYSRPLWTFTLGPGGITITHYHGSYPYVWIPDSLGGYPVIGIGNDAFSHTDTISITFGNRMTNVAESAFGYCDTLQWIQVDATNPEYSDLDGVLFDKARTRIVAYPAGRTGAYSIPDGVTSIGNGAFHQCYDMTAVTLPGTVTNIGDSAFQSCWHITTFTMPDTVTHIGDGAFAYCSRLAGVSIPSSLTRIGDRLFDGCRSLATVTIPDGVASIGERAFAGCTALASVRIPESITTIRAAAFTDCSGLTSVFCEGDVPLFDIPNDAFRGATAAIVYYRPGTSGWAEMVVRRPLALWIPLSVGEPRDPPATPLRLLSATPAPESLTIQRSTNLRDWEDWQTVSRDEGPGELNDPEAGAVPYRFYRAVGH